MEKYLEEILRQNETFRTQVISLNSKVDMLTSDLQDNRITRDTVLTDLDSVNELAVKLNTDKVNTVGFKDKDALGGTQRILLGP